MDTYRMEVGRTDGIQVKNVVGAIANEANLDSKFIGGIRLHDNYTTVELPSDIPKETLDHLYKSFVCSKAMKLTKLQSGTLPDDRPRRSAPPRDGAPRDGGRERTESRGHRGSRNDSPRGDSRPPSRAPRRDK
jgi:ATP-dependent RNA helicase DeaD